VIRYIGTAHSFEYLSGGGCEPPGGVTWSFTIMRMSKGSYTVVLIRDWREVFTLEYRDLLLDARPQPYRNDCAGKIDGIPGDVLSEVEKALCAVERGGLPVGTPPLGVWERVHEILDREGEEA